jgi:DNA-binding CsgD family transcriptional regulator
MWGDVTQFQDCSKLTLSTWSAALRAVPMSDVTEVNLLTWVEGPLRQFLPFERFVGVYGNVSGGRFHMRSLLSSGHTPEFLAGLESTFDLKSGGCFGWWVANRKPFILEREAGGRDEVGTRISATQRELATEVEQRSVGIYAAHGVIDSFANADTYFGFSGVPGDQPKLTFTALDLVTPVLHKLFLQTRRAEHLPIDLSALTDRQRELMDLAVQGLSDKAIAWRLAISENTVGNHFRAIYAKLGIAKRSKLIALLR